MKNQAHAFDASPKKPEAVMFADDLPLAALIKQIQSSETYAEVSIREEAAEAIFEAMEKQHVTRAELARRLGKSRAYVTKVLSGEENLGIETLSKIFRALDCQYRIEYSPSISQNPLWAKPPTAPNPLMRRISGGAPLDWKPMSQAQLVLIPDESGRWQEEALALC